MNRQIVNEIYRAFVLLGAKHDLLGVVGSIDSSLPDEDVFAEIKAWNERHHEEIKDRIEHYEISSPLSDYIPSVGRENSQAKL
jgi:hypothetical protein